MEKFFDKIFHEPNSGCWLWGGAVDGCGYGMLRRDGKFHKAHRFSYEYHLGQIPTGLNICHSCDTPACVNPDHLYAATQKKNMQDMVARGRWGGPIGENHHKTKLTLEQVKEIRNRTESIDILAPIYGVDRSTIARVRRGATWKRAAEYAT